MTKGNIQILSNVEPEEDQELQDTVSQKHIPSKKVKRVSSPTTNRNMPEVISVKKPLGRPRSENYKLIYPSVDFSIPELVDEKNNYTMIYQRVQVDVKKGILEEVDRRKNNKGKGAHIRIFRKKSQ